MFRRYRFIPTLEARAAAISVVVGITLLVVKFVAYFLTGSSAVFSDAMESIVNVAASFMAFYALGLAHSPADPEHPYGHGKIEFISAGFEGGMILMAGLLILVKTFVVLASGQIVIEKTGFGLAFMALAMLVNGATGLYLLRTGRRQKSMALEADGHHLLSDAVTSIAALAALLVVVLLRWPWADPLAALLIALYIGWMGVRLLGRAGAGLMDRQDLQDEQLLQRILDAHLAPDGQPPLICSYHKLRHRHSGRYHWVDFHIMVPPHLSVQAGHDVASKIEYEIEQALGEGNATAHIEPCPEQQCTDCGQCARADEA